MYPMPKPRLSVVSFFTLLMAAALPVRADLQLSLATLGTARQSGTNTVFPASQAVDGNTGTFSETTDQTNSFWEFEMSRKVRISRVDLVTPSIAANGLVVRIYDLRDRTLFRAVVSGATANG